MSSLAVGRGLERELYWLGDLFTAAELVAAELLLRLRGDDEDDEERVVEKAVASEAAATSLSSGRSAISWREDLTVAEEEERDGAEVASTTFSPKRSDRSFREDLAVVEGLEPPPPWIAKETAPSLGSTMELDRRARKRYRLLSELYAATPVASPAVAKRRTRRRGTVNSIERETSTAPWRRTFV